MPMFSIVSMAMKTDRYYQLGDQDARAYRLATGSSQFRHVYAQSPDPLWIDFPGWPKSVQSYPANWLVARVLSPAFGLFYS